MTGLMHKLRKGGADVDTGILTVKEAEEEIFNYLLRKKKP